jgi:hypothetical protein
MKIERQGNKIKYEFGINLEQIILPLSQVHVGFLAYNIRVASTNTFNGGQSVHNFLFAINIGIEQTNNMLEVGLITDSQSLQKCPHLI